MGKTDRVLSANSRNAFCGLECMRNMQKASSYRVSSITRQRTKSRIDRKDKQSFEEQDYLQDAEPNVDDEMNNSGYKLKVNCQVFEEEFDFEREPQEDDKPSDIEYMRSQQIYVRACKTLGHSPVTAFHRGLPTESIVLKHHVLGPERIKACAIALVANTTVKYLTLVDNDVGEIGAFYLAEMLEENCNITDLTISYNNIGREGLHSLSYAIQRNDTITKLDLSGNNFEDIDAKHIVAILEENPLIRELRIHHNKFLEHGAILLAEALGHIDNLELLDLSWNHIRYKGAVAICEGIAKNCSITDLNLSWNGFGLEGCKALSKALSENSTITHLDISCNRIDLPALNELVFGLKFNKSMISIKLSENPLTSDGAMVLLDMLDDAIGKTIKNIDISSQTVSTGFCQKLENLQQKRKVQIKHGRMIEVDYGEKTASDSFEKEDPMMVLMEFMRIKNFRLIDLFKSLDADGSHSLTRKEFKDGLLGVNIPMSSAAIDKLLDMLDEDKDGEVDFSELMQGQRRHKAKVRAMKQKEKGIPPEKSELVRINTKLQRVLSFRRRTLHTIEFTPKETPAIAEEEE